MTKSGYVTSPQLNSWKICQTDVLFYMHLAPWTIQLIYVKDLTCTSHTGVSKYRITTSHTGVSKYRITVYQWWLQLHIHFSYFDILLHFGMILKNNHFVCTCTHTELRICLYISKKLCHNLLIQQILIHYPESKMKTFSRNSRETTVILQTVPPSWVHIKYTITL